MPGEAQLVIAQSTGAVGRVGRMGTDARDVGASVVTLEYRRVSFLLVHQLCAFRRHCSVLCTWETRGETSGYAHSQIETTPGYLGVLQSQRIPKIPKTMDEAHATITNPSF